MRNILFLLLLLTTLLIGCRPYPEKSAETAIIATTAEELDLKIASTANPDKNIRETSSPIPSEPNSTETLSATTETGLGIGLTTTRDMDGMKMVYVPAGAFDMGSENVFFDEEPMHRVILPGYWIDKTEITNGMYALCVKAGGCTSPSNFSSSTRSSYYGNSNFDGHPVIYISWFDAVAYCQWVGGRLPTEAEWEKAARGVDGREYPWGNDTPNDNLLNYGGDFDTSKVGFYPLGAGPYGALDMAGNVWEWVSDLYGSDYYSTSPLEAPTGPETGEFRVLRGGGWDSFASGSARVAIRSKINPDYVSHNIGFRCVRSE